MSRGRPSDVLQLEQGSSLRERLSDLLTEHEMSIREAAEAAGVSRGTIGNLLTGKTLDPPCSTLFRLAHRFNVRLSWLFVGEEPRTSRGKMSGEAEKLAEIYDSLSPSERHEMLLYVAWMRMRNEEVGAQTSSKILATLHRMTVEPK